MLDDVRDNFGLYNFWDTTWDLATNTLSIMYDY